MNNKTMINLDNNLMLKSENIEYNNDSLKNILDELNFEDVTSRLTFVNCTLQTGKVLKFGKLVFMHLKIVPTITSGWGNVVQNLPDDLFPFLLHDGGAPVVGSTFWIYGQNKRTLTGEITKDKVTLISGFYILQN